MKKPNFFIVGLPKSGTTALHDFLNEHPQIYMSKVKEPHFFCLDFHNESDDFHKSKLFFHFRSQQSYLKLFSDVTSEKIIGESSTGYLYSKVAAQEIYNLNPKAKIIIILREPASFLYSVHSQVLNINAEIEQDFVKALELEPLRMQGKFIPSTVHCPSALFYSERAKYYEQVKRYYETFDPSQIKVIIFEDFKKNNQLVYKEILEFLGVNSSFYPEYNSVNARSKPRYKWLNQILYHPVSRAIAYKLFPPAFNEFIKRNIVENLFWKRDNSSPISIEVKNKLMKQFYSEVQMISQLTSIDTIKKWGYDNLK